MLSFTGVLETEEVHRAEGEALPAAEEVPEVQAHQEAIQDVPAGVLVLPEAVTRTTAPEIADPRGSGM